MDISFVIPAYNEESFIGPCLQSIKKEIERVGCSAEIIIANNNSTDRTREVALAIAGVRVVDEARKGTNWARQAGFSAAAGELVANIDADTMLPEGWLTTVFDEFKADEKLVALGGPYIYYDLPPIDRAITALFEFGMYLAYLLNRFVLRVGSQLLGGNCVMRRSALEHIGGYNTSLTFFGDDLDTAKRLMTQGKVRFTYRLPALSSGRRQAKLGMTKVGWEYLVNFLSQLYHGAPASTHETDVRTPTGKTMVSTAPMEIQEEIAVP